MDPNEALKKARKAAKVLNDDPLGPSGANAEETEDLMQAFQALDEWLSKGGVPPDAWTEKGEGLTCSVAGCVRKAAHIALVCDEHGGPLQ